MILASRNFEPVRILTSERRAERVQPFDDEEIYWVIQSKYGKWTYSHLYRIDFLRKVKEGDYRDCIKNFSEIVELILKYEDSLL